ncbi:carboxypeptidase-like regulatory domain-containing protein [Chitinophaga sedimenti]|uniref:carboxypeptidase-like regulatory domain-containing protein n=1 Tax=Chitinophaga sedimenti TaxID=2033606 RepID=UPI002004A870|nr:carboxypeptidase-like regulatory domain-containing protein [Chitinophaga sedimenti]MCK7554631.1 carboxypeptidase-like regulatory domain-containing protein [Chitinophaga sedimenti]
MSIIRLLVFICLLCFPTLLFAQNTLSGVVKDSVGRPVNGASVTIIDKDGAGITFERTDQKGVFNCTYSGGNEHRPLR